MAVKKQLKIKDFLDQCHKDNFKVRSSQVTAWSYRGSIKKKQVKGKNVYFYDKAQIADLMTRTRNTKVTKVLNSNGGSNSGPKPGQKPRVKGSITLKIMKVLMEEAALYNLEPTDYVELLDRAKAKSLV